MSRLPGRVLPAIALLTAIGCSSDGGEGPTGSISLTASPAALNLPQGGTGTVTVTLTRGGGFSGAVNIAVLGLPTGVTLSVEPPQLTGQTTQAVVTVTVGNAVPAGTYTATVSGSASGVGTATTSYTLTVAGTPGGGLVWEFCNSGAVPLKFWRLSGGTWSEVAPTVVSNATRFTFTVSGTSAGVAYTVSNTGAAARTSMRTRQPSALRTFTRQIREKAGSARQRLASADVALTTPYFDTFVLFALASELAGSQETCETTPALVAKTFNVSGQGPNEVGLLGYGSASASLAAQTTSYNLMVEAGSYDWMAAFGPSPTFPDPSYDWSAYRIGRNEAAPGSAVAVNRVGATAFTAFPFTVAGGNAGSFFTFSQNLEGARGQIIAFPIGSSLNQTGNGTMLFLSPGDRLGTDLMSLELSNTELIGNNIDFRSSIRYVGSAPPASGNFTLNSSVPPFTVSPVNGAPVPTWSASGNTPNDYQTASSRVAAAITGAGDSTLYTIVATRGWLAANNFNTNYTLTGPTLPGFLAQWAPAAPLIDSQVIMIGSNFTTAPAAGSILNIAFRLQAP